MKQSLALRAGLALTMTPALQQAIRLLQLSSLDLQIEIRQALESNVMLELSDGEPEAEAEAVADVEASSEAGAGESVAESALDLGERAEIPEEMPVDADWEDIYDAAEPRSATLLTGAVDPVTLEIIRGGLRAIQSDA